MATITIGTETQSGNAWIYDATVQDGGRTFHFVVTLNWSDYDLWSHGRVRPERVVEKLFEFLLDRESAVSIMPKFDCAVARRYFPEVDRELPAMVATGPNV
ncbi:MAG: hypothetical protein WD042_07710 [Phycisphaeraceae bacterium]